MRNILTIVMALAAMFCMSDLSAQVKNGKGHSSGFNVAGRSDTPNNKTSTQSKPHQRPGKSGKSGASSESSETVATPEETVIVPVSEKLEMVDLGLSVKWASINIGAKKSTDLGDMYYWGDVKPNQSRPTYKDDSQVFKKYVRQQHQGNWAGNYTKPKTSPDNLVTLLPMDDAAHVVLGGKWRMPKSKDWNELINGCNWEWTKINGVVGYKISGKKKGYTDKWIFLPALNQTSNPVCIYWTKELGSQSWDAFVFTGNGEKREVSSQARDSSWARIRAVAD